MKPTDVCESCAGPLASRHERQAHLCRRCEFAGAWDGEEYKRELATVRRFCAKARRLNLDWTRIPEPMAFATRMKALLAPYATATNGAVDGAVDGALASGEAA